MRMMSILVGSSDRPPMWSPYGSERWNKKKQLCLILDNHQQSASKNGGFFFSPSQTLLLLFFVFVHWYARMNLIKHESKFSLSRSKESLPFFSRTLHGVDLIFPFLCWIDFAPFKLFVEFFVEISYTSHSWRKAKNKKHNIKFSIAHSIFREIAGRYLHFLTSLWHAEKVLLNWGWYSSALLVMKIVTL